jgi:hypothetical protein
MVPIAKTDGAALSGLCERDYLTANVQSLCVG